MSAAEIQQSERDVVRSLQLENFPLEVKHSDKTRPSRADTCWLHKLNHGLTEGILRDGR